MVDHYGQINSDFRDQFRSYKFEKEYRLSKGLDSDMHPLKTWFKEDIIKWMSNWDTPCVRGELFHAKITVYYATRSGISTSVTEHYKYYSDTPLGSNLRLLRWQLILVLGTVGARLALDEGNSVVSSVYVNLEWSELPDGVNDLWEIINHDEGSTSHP